VRFQLLGPLEVGTAAGPVAIPAKRPRALLAILLLHAPEVVSLDRIIDGIWDGRPPRSALENVRTYVSQLRSLLSPAERSRLESHPAGYRLTVAPEELDLLRFGALAAEGEQALARGDFAHAAAVLGEAQELWRGAPLPELVLGGAVRAKIDALEERRRHVQTEWISARLALGHHAELLPILRELIGERPLDERLRALLMTALYATGRTAEALAAFADARQTLVQELGIDPGPQLRRVQAAILSGEAVAEAPRAVPVPLAPMTPAAVTTNPYSEIPHRLPVSGIDLGGRAAVVAICGPPGIGKTATAMAATAKVAAAYPDGRLYADLGGSTDRPLSPGDAVNRLLSEPAALAAAPEVEASGWWGPQEGHGPWARYRGLLADRRMLIVLDDAADASQVLPLIPVRGGGSLVLVTSRDPLPGVGCDVRLDLARLSRDDGLHRLLSVVGAELADVAQDERAQRCLGALGLAGP
jgi:DNA-binding SARP family transcriptional activator